MSNWFLENPEREEETETDQQMRTRYIQQRVRKARQVETIEAMKERYQGYGYPL